MLRLTEGNHKIIDYSIEITNGHNIRSVRKNTNYEFYTPTIW